MSYDALQKHRRLWNDPENVLKESLIGTAMLHRHLAYLESCQAILRRDCDKLIGKVRIIGGGAVIDGPMYSGFVGPGMLTAAVLGLHGTASTVPTSDSILEAITRAVKDKESTSGVLLLAQDCTEYYISFSAARNKAQDLGIPTKIIFVRDELTEKLSQKPMSPRSPSGLLLLYKIAGAMAEEGRSLEEIYNVCDRIVRTGVCFSIGVYIIENLFKPANILICRGDRLSDRDTKRLSVDTASTKTVVENLAKDLTSLDNRQKFPLRSKLALMFDYFGLTELEANIFIKELIQQLNQLQFEIQVIYTGVFHTSIEVNGFHLSVLNLSSSSQILYYLDAPTLAYSWPKCIERKIDYQTRARSKHTKTETERRQHEDRNKAKLNQETTSVEIATFETDVLLTAIEFACEALIACASKIDLLDQSLVSEELDRCGSRLANVALATKMAIHQNKFAGLNLSNIIFHVALIFEQRAEDPQAELYTIFLNTLASAIEDQQYLEASDWFDGFVRSIHAVDKITKGTKFSDTFFAAKAAFCDAFAEDDNVNIIYALDQAVSAAQKQTSHVQPETGKIPENIFNEKDRGFSGLAGAHAIGVWMRGAYEGIKYKLSRKNARAKRMRSNEVEYDDIQRMSKAPKVQDRFED